MGEKNMDGDRWIPGIQRSSEKSRFSLNHTLWYQKHRFCCMCHPPKQPIKWGAFLGRPVPSIFLSLIHCDRPLWCKLRRRCQEQDPRMSRCDERIAALRDVMLYVAVVAGFVEARATCMFVSTMIFVICKGSTIKFWLHMELHNPQAGIFPHLRFRFLEEGAGVPTPWTALTWCL